MNNIIIIEETLQEEMVMCEQTISFLCINEGKSYNIALVYCEFLNII